MRLASNRELKKHWKHQCPKDRFDYSTEIVMQGDVEQERWQVHDREYGLCLSFGEGKRWEQIEGARFCKNYVRIHGDINFNSFPYGMFDPISWANENREMFDITDDPREVE